MKKVKYFFQYLIIKVLFFLFKILGYENSSNFGGLIGKIFGPFLKSKKIIKENILKLNPNFSEDEIDNLTKLMWENYGRIFAEYMFIKDFRLNKLSKYIKINGESNLNEIKLNNKPVVFISAHFSNFELMAMQIEKSGINLGAVYRPLNNIYLNKTMENLRKNYICRNQIKKGISGVREILKLFQKNFSVAMMIDQRVTEGLKISFFNSYAYTTSIPAQLVKKFDCPIIPVHIERKNKIYFEITFGKPINFDKHDNLETISQSLNNWLEKMISKNPSQWIWSHNRWKL
mgnify:FL=1|tara:strand:+ start:1485 stop:2348 length:864 start_codon:yes stop_codon:yes gene_type:complete